MLKPRNDYVLIQRDKPQTKSAGGIEFVLARDAVEAPEWGEVLEIGPKVEDVKKGDRVLIGQFAGDTVRVNGQSVVMLRAGEILAVSEHG